MYKSSYSLFSLDMLALMLFLLLFTVHPVLTFQSLGKTVCFVLS